ncbi:amidohydrolase family protein, partial [candidate division CSSED10-310 bacterium]
MIIDAHTHIEGLPGCPWLDPPEMILRLMDEAGIEKAAVMTYVDAPLAHPAYDPIVYVREAVERYPDRLIGFVRLNPGAAQAAELLIKAIKDWGFSGLKLHPSGYRQPPDSAETVRLLRLAAQLGVPVLFHCGDEDHTLPLEIERAATLCPETTIILGHMGGYFHVDDAIEVACRCPNIILETSAMPRPHCISTARDRIGAQRIIYGSDGPGCDPRL